MNPRGAFGLKRANGQKIWAADLWTNGSCEATSRELGIVRPTTERCGREFARRVAGEGRRGDAGQRPKWVRNSVAHPTMAGTLPEVGYSGGATRRGGGEATGNMAMALRANRGQVSATTRLTKAQGTLRHDPEALRSPETSRRRGIAAAGPKRGKPLRPELS